MKPPPAPPAPASDPSRPFGDDAALVAALRNKERGAAEELYARHGPYMERVLVRIMGLDPELPDLLQEAFLQAIRSLDSLRDPSRLRPWLAQISVFIARACIRRRQRNGWLQVFSTPPEFGDLGATPEQRRAALAAAAVIEKLEPEQRIGFALRYVEGMKLEECAEVCGCSLATIKRRLKRAEKRFVALAKADPLLRDQLAGSRWSID